MHHAHGWSHFSTETETQQKSEGRQDILGVPELRRMVGAEKKPPQDNKGSKLRDYGDEAKLHSAGRHCQVSPHIEVDLPEAPHAR